MLSVLKAASREESIESGLEGFLLLRGFHEHDKKGRENS
jgi:hypothetical protein